MTEPEIDMRNGHSHCHGSGKYDRCAEVTVTVMVQVNTTGVQK